MFFCSLGAQALVVDLADGDTITVHRLADTEKIKVDGRLDEDVWGNLPAYDEFVVIEPDTFARVPHRTLVRFAYGKAGLYVGIEMEQPKETLIKRLSGRDARQINRDSINLTLDTSGEGRYGYWFGVALGDSLMDGTVLPERHFTSDWDGAWRGASAETDHGWSAEMFIPWGTVSMPASGDTRRIGLYMSRKVAYIDERWGWPALPDTVPRFMSVLQPLEFAGVNPRQQYSIFPFVALGRDRIDQQTKHRVGADFFWRPSTNFQMSGTINPDFGNVESDDVVINLSATETFFPEKRLFFLEGQEVFVASPRADTRGGGVGNAGSPTTMVNTRRIGGKPRAVTLPAGGSLSKREEFKPVDLKGAVKATGQVGRFRYGVLAAAEDDVVIEATLAGSPYPIAQDGSDYGIARLLYEDSVDGDYRAFGVLSTAVLNQAGDALAQGVDAHYLSRDGKWKLDTQLFTSDIEGSERGYGGFLDAQYTIAKGVYQRVGLEYLDKHVDINDLGYLARNDSLRLRAAHIRTTSGLGWARDNQFDVRGFLQQNNDGYFTGGGIFFSDRLTLNNLSSVTMRINYNLRAYDDLNSEGNGTYRVKAMPSVSLKYSSDSTGTFSFGGGVSFSTEDLGGEHYSIGGGFTWNPSDQFTLHADINYRNRHGWLLHDEDRNMTTFNAEQWGPKLSIDYFLTARQQLRTSFQWVGIQAHEKEFFLVPLTPGDLIATAKPPGPSDSFGISQMVMQVRYRWELAPLSDLFVVYTRGADRAIGLRDNSFGDLLEDGWNNPIGDVFVVKLRYRFGS
ncbi:MAG: hypothetical protein KDI19_06420 [Pseudomonadales bacterium]|nr:hypothetical protein [Pseudomonadales bacterium]